MKQEKTSVWLAVTMALLLCLSCTFTIDPSAEKEERQRIAEVKKRLEENPTLINAPNGPEGTPLHFAVLKNSMSLVHWLFAHGADANVRDSSGETPLHGAVFWDHTPRREFISTLVENGADINAQDNSGDTPLHVAASTGDTTSAKVLLSYKADVNARTEYGMTPLHEAASNSIPTMGEDYIGTAELLLQHKADVNARDHLGLTPIHMATMFENSEMIGLLSAHGADINAGNSSGWTPLHVAAMAGEAETANLLIAHGAAVNARDQDGRTALFRALKSQPLTLKGQ